jgi:hypothetical protein
MGFTELILHDRNDKEALLGLRTAVILVFAALTGLGAGVLTVLSGQSPAGGVLAGGAAFAAAVLFFQAIIA